MQTASQPKKSSLPLIIITLLVLGGGYLLVRRSGAAKAGMGRGAPVLPVSTTVAKVGRINVFIDAIGTVTPLSTVTVTSRVAGALTEVDFTEGQQVKKGDLLAVVDPRPYQASLMQAQGQLMRDQALLRNAQLDLARYEDAFKQHAIPEQQYATQKAAVDEAAGVVRLDEGNLAVAQVNVDYTQLRSPIDGRVGLRQLDVGNIVQANGTVPLTTITQLDPITVVFTLAEDRLAEVMAEMNRGQALKVIAYDRTQQTKLAAGTLIAVDSQIDTTTGTIKARASFANHDGKLFPNQFVNTRLLLKTLDQAILVPSAAVQMNDDQRFVYTVDQDSVANLRSVKVITVEGEMTAITDIKPGEVVVTDGFDRVQNGSKVSAGQPAGDKAHASRNGAQ